MTLNDIITYAKENDIDFDSPIETLFPYQDGYDSFSIDKDFIEQVGIGVKGRLVLIPSELADRTNLRSLKIRNVVNEV